MCVNVLVLVYGFSGSELKADDFLYSPSDMVEILIMGRLSVLSPDIYVADDRLGKHLLVLDEFNI